VFGAFVAEPRRVDAGEKMFPGAEQDRCNGEVHIVDQSGPQILPDRRHSAAEADVLAAGGVDGAFKRLIDAVGDEMKRGAAAHGE